MTTLADALHPRRGPAWANRLALAPMTNKQSRADGVLTDTEITWLVARARGGFGMVMTAAAFVAPAGQAWAGQLGIASDTHVAGLARLADGIRAAGSVSSVQLHHGGSRADATASGVPLVGPWDDEATGARALTTGEVAGVVEAFAAAAARAERAGLDGAEVHAAHGYLLGQFLDAERNQRTDGYGGDASGRARIVHEVVAAIRAATGPDFQLGVRLSPERFGIEIDEAVALASDLLAGGELDYLDASLWDVRKLPAGATDGPRLIERFADLPRHGTLLGVAGQVRSAADARWALDAGADFALIGRAAIADHAFARHALADDTYPGPTFPVTRDQLRAEFLGESFVDYVATGWPALVAD